MNPAIFVFDNPSCENENTVVPCCGYSSVGQDGGNYDCNEGLEAEEQKVVSEIKETGQPYKEIEAIINNSRLVLRIQKERPIEEDEWDPPCDCLPGSSPKQTDKKLSDPHRVLPKFSQNPSRLPPDLNSTAERITRPEYHGKSTPRPIDLVENPNIFLLKIRKRSLTTDKRRENIDLEIRIPRPFKPKPIERIKKRKVMEPPTVLEEVLEKTESEKEIDVEPKKSTKKPKKKGNKKK